MIVALLVAALQSPPEEAVKKVAADLERLFKAADADGNGALTPAEFRGFEAAVIAAADAALDALDPVGAQKRAAKDLKKHDANQDGKLDAAETKAIAEAKRLKDFDWDDDGVLNEKEKQAAEWAAEGKSLKHFRKVDADANGGLSLAEARTGLAYLSDLKFKKAE